MSRKHKRLVSREYELRKEQRRDERQHPQRREPGITVRDQITPLAEYANHARIGDFDGQNARSGAEEKEVDTMNTLNTLSAPRMAQTLETSGETFAEGLITEGSRGRYRVETPAGALWCVVRGRLRKDLIYAESTSARRAARAVKVNQHDPVAIGDHVMARQTGPGEGVIERIIARAGAALTRQDPDPEPNRQLTMVAGIEQFVVVFAAREPAPHLRLADRFIALAESQDARVVLCMNKADQGIEPWLRERLAVYAGLGYEVVTTSAITGEGIEALRGLLVGRVSALTGPSGVGKSSLLNALEPGLALRVSAVSASTGKGRHTTTGARMVALSGVTGGWLADTAGIRALALDPGALIDLPWLFREFRPLRGQCAFADCAHLSEPDCAVIAAARSGALDAERYDSYRRMAQSATPDDSDERWIDGWYDPGRRKEAWHDRDG